MESHTAAKPGTAQRVEMVSYPEFVDRQLNKVTRQLEAGELLTGMVRWLSVTLFVVLSVVLWDHWISDLPGWSRLVVTVGIITISASQFIRHVVPPIRRRISPAFAAKMVESAEPGLKNGLINLIFLRKTPAQVNEVVLRELEQQTATRLTSIDVESSVDRTLLVRWVAVLAMAIVLATAYAALAPKSLWQSVRRALNPWSAAARPSRVLLSDIQPGDCQTYYGRVVVVTAQVGRLRERESVELVYSSVDGQVVDRRIEMRLGPDGRFAAALPDDSPGATQDLVYRVEAGDATAGPFHVEVLEVPSAVIDKLRYDYPTYTQLPPRETTEGGDLEALEGTRVSWWIRTNHDVAEAFLELDPEPGPVPVPPRSGARAPLQCTGKSATGEWVLQLRPDRQIPLHASYRIRFQSLDGQWNLEPVTHRVQVVPDLTPDVEILRPTTRDTQLPLNRVLTIEIRARDPDFALSRVELKGLHQGRDILSEVLLAEETPGQVIKSYPLRPDKLGFEVGDMLFVWAEASDNRHDPVSQKAAPNVGRTMDYRITVVEPDERQQGQSDDESDQGTGDESDQGTGGESDQGTGGEAGAEQGPNGNQDAASEDDANQPGGTGSSQQPSPDQEQQDRPADSGEQPSQQREVQDENGESTGPSQSDQSSNQDESAGASEQQDQSPTEPDGAEGTGEEGTGEGTERGESDRQNGGNTNSDSVQPDSSAESSDSAGPRPEQSAGGRSGEDGQPSRDAERSGPQDNAEQQPGNGNRRGENAAETPQDDRAASEEPLPNDGSRDGDAFERILDQMRRNDGNESDRQTGRPSPQRPDAGAEPEQGESPEDANKTPRHGSDRGDPTADRHADEVERSDAGGAPERDERDAPSEAEPSDREATDEAAATGPQDDRADDSTGSPSQEATDAQDTEDEGINGRGTDGQPADGTPVDPAEQQEAGAGDRGTDGQRDESGTGQRSETTEQAARPGEPGAEPRDRSESPPRPGASDTPQTGEQTGPQESGTPGDAEGGTDAESEREPPPGQAASEPGINQGRGTDQQFEGADEELFDQEDPANLEYAKQATEMALEYLKDQEQNPDRELLDRLGWSPDDLRRFVERWEQMRQEANQSGPTADRARDKLDQLLRGLGLVPQEDRVEQRRLTNERVEGVQEEGRRSEPPADYQELYRAYLKSRQGSTPAESP